MTLTDALRDDDSNADLRVTNGDRWLTCTANVFGVYERKPYAKHTQRIIETEIEDEAVQALLGRVN